MSSRWLDSADVSEVLFCVEGRVLCAGRGGVSVFEPRVLTDSLGVLVVLMDFLVAWIGTGGASSLLSESARQFEIMD